MKKVKKMKERILSIVLTLTMVMSLLAGMAPVEVKAEEELSLTGNTERASHISHETELFEDTVVTQLETEGNYYLTSDVTTGASITINGTVNLCLNGYVLETGVIIVSEGPAAALVAGSRGLSDGERCVEKQDSLTRPACQLSVRRLVHSDFHLQFFEDVFERWRLLHSACNREAEPVSLSFSVVGVLTENDHPCVLT